VDSPPHWEGHTPARINLTQNPTSDYEFLKHLFSDDMLMKVTSGDSEDKSKLRSSNKKNPLQAIKT